MSPRVATILDQPPCTLTIKIYSQGRKVIPKVRYDLGPSINGLVTDGNTKLCCRDFILALFQSTTANKIDSEHTRDYKRLLTVCEAEILRATLKELKFAHLFMLIFANFRLQVS